MMTTEKGTFSKGHRRFLIGLSSLSLGQGFFATRYAFDRTGLEVSTTVGLGSHVMMAVGTAVLAYIAYTDLDTFDFEGSTRKRYAATITFVAGIVVVATGVLTFVVTVVG